MKTIIMLCTLEYASQMFAETKDERYKQIVLAFNNGEHHELNNSHYSVIQ